MTYTVLNPETGYPWGITHAMVAGGWDKIRLSDVMHPELAGMDPTLYQSVVTSVMAEDGKSLLVENMVGAWAQRMDQVRQRALAIMEAPLLFKPEAIMDAEAEGRYAGGWMVFWRRSEG